MQRLGVPSIAILLSGCMILALSVAPAVSSDALVVGAFSSGRPGSGLPEGWTPLTFKKVSKHTDYELVREGETAVVKATSEASASGLTKEVRIDPKDYPIVRWRWKVDNLVKHSDVSRKDGDDYPARLYITFAYDPDKVSWARKLKYQAGRAIFGDIPIAALNYIWETRTPVGTIVENAYTDFARMIVVESGPERVGMWVEEERNIYEDYKAAFGGEPPMINGVAIMSDTDDTKGRATAYYGNIIFMKAKR